MKNSVEENVDTCTSNHVLKLSETLEEKFSFENLSDIEATVFRKLSKNDFLKLTTVVLKGAMLSSLPDIPFINVVKFDLSDNNLSDIPMSLSLLRKLQILNLSQNQFKRVPQCMAGGFIALKHLFLSQNQIVNLRFMACLCSLQLLDIHSNNIDSFPEWLISTNCESLMELDISNNFCFKYETEKGIDELLDLLCRPRGTTISQTLKKLTLSNCQLIENSSEILSLFPNLRELNLGNDGPSLKHLSIEHNFLPKMPLSSMMNMQNLSILRLANVSLRDLTDKISEFENLQVLDVRNNDLNWLPNGFCDLKNLELCDLSNNDLYYLPDKIGNLSNLSIFLLSFNRLSDLPKGFGQLKNLKFLDLFFNQFSEMPEVLLNLNLEGIDLENNHFDSSFLQLKNMEYLMLLKKFRNKHQLTRMFGFRPEVECKIDEEIETSSDSNQLEASIGLGSSEEDVEICHSIYSEECWDTEVDEDDLYNPYDLPPPYIRELKHSSRRKTFYFRASPPVEGQFDDAVSD